MTAVGRVRKSSQPGPAAAYAAKLPFDHGIVSGSSGSIAPFQFFQERTLKYEALITSSSDCQWPVRPRSGRSCRSA